MNAKRVPSSKVKKDAARRHRHELASTAIGALGGAGMGAIAAGPPGALVGALLGGAAGTLTAWSSEANSVDVAANDHKLDAEVGGSTDLAQADAPIPPPPH